MATDRTSQQLATLESLLAISVADMELALIHASDLVAKVLAADKVDVFLYDDSRDTLKAVGSSTQPLSALQKKHGLDTLPVANGGRTVEAYLTGKTFADGHVEADKEELRGVRETLRVRSTIAAPLEVGTSRRGVLLLASLQPERWTAEDARFSETVAHWIVAVVRQAELVAELEKNAVAAGRRSAAEELVTVLAHDLRNFIYPVDLSIQLVERRADREARTDDAKDAAKARRGLARLNGLITEILDVARIEQGILQVERRPTALVALAEEIASLMSSAEHTVVVLAREEVTALVDPARVRQALENLIGNALKHSPKLAPVEIQVKRVETPEGPRAEIIVVDQGPGITGELLPHVFERFVTGPKRTGGLGLGLFLARQIALLHDGDLRAESELGRGSRFTLSVPCDPSDDS